MQKKLLRKNLMHSEAIRQVNDATVVLRHFIELSAKLLPYLNKLCSKRMLDERERYDKDRIIDVFASYGFDTSTSMILMNSTVLETIKDTFELIRDRKPGRSSQVDRAVVGFLKEHRELAEQWVMTDCN